MSKYRKKPVVIEEEKVSEILKLAYTNCGTCTDISQAKWIRDAINKEIIILGDTNLHITTLEGTMTADYDDMVIQGVNGELYPCKPDIFEKTYEKI